MPPNMRILLIEDELPAARQLARLLREARPDGAILDTLDSVESAVSWLRTFPPPDLIFMDIQIADGLSFDIFQQVEVAAPVIFTTAFDQYALQAFRVNAIDYLLKPVDPEELVAALHKVEQRRSAALPDLAALARYFSPREYKERFMVKAGKHFQMLRADDIACFHSADGFTQALDTGGKKHFVDHTLDELEQLLDPRRFFSRRAQSHRTHQCGAAGGDAFQRPPQVRDQTRAGRGGFCEPGARGGVQGVAGRVKYRRL